MSYNYQTERPTLFTEEGQVLLLKIRDNAKHLLDIAGAFDWGHVVKGVSGDSWQMLACVDRLVELGEVKELLQPNCAGQYRVFVAAERST